MSSDKQNYKQEFMKTFSIVYVIIGLVFGLILWQVIRLSLWAGSDYRALGDVAAHDSLIVEANRGNIYDCNGNLLAGTIPSYRLHMDMRAEGLERDTFNKYIDSLCICLSRVYGTKGPGAFKSELRSAYRAGKRYYLVDPKRLSYTQYKLVQKFPLFRKGKKSGMCWEESIHREHPYGKLGARTIGNNYANGRGYSGLERAFDSLLAGHNGTAFKQKKGGQWIKVNIVNPIDGLDIVSTLDIDMQDIAEEALEKNLTRSNAEWGCAVVMEVETGEIKAIANLKKGKDSAYFESQNYAVSAMTEPGSTFKTASIMAALDDGVTDTSEIFDTGNGYWKEEDWTMTDHNVKYNTKDHKIFSDSGGYHEITLGKALRVSSNIGIAKMVDKYYRNNPQRFVNLLYDMRLKEPLDIIIPGAATPKLADPSDPKWNRTTLLWMSFGYNVQIPPIYTLTYYNGIANDGKMISPVFVKSINEHGTVVKRFGTKVIKNHLCSNGTLKKVRALLEGVVSDGTGSVFKSDIVKFAGKTGTAQTNYWGKTASTDRKHQYSFCGYFPADKPKYSCIVVVFQPTNRGISPAGLTFKEIAEHVMAKQYRELDTDRDEIGAPVSLKGNFKALEKVFDHLDIPFQVEGDKDKKNWTMTQACDSDYKVIVKPYSIQSNLVPNVTGMGAKDAIFLMQKCGLRVRLVGYGDVVQQSIPWGTLAPKGSVVQLVLRHH